ncbi:hypothetical protein CUMW_141580 [Citrus unshiu]|nr:hypothetical protein CUMW_141580 [Citrus unshiu]
MRERDYIDVIAGTSSVRLITAMLSMLTASDYRGRPLYQENDIIPFQLKHGPKIFPQSQYDT